MEKRKGEEAARSRRRLMLKITLFFSFGCYIKAHVTSYRAVSNINLTSIRELILVLILILFQTLRFHSFCQYPI